MTFNFFKLIFPILLSHIKNKKVDYLNKSDKYLKKI